MSLTVGDNPSQTGPSQTKPGTPDLGSVASTQPASEQDSVVNDSDTKTEYLTPDGEPNVALLKDRTPLWARTTAASLWITFVLAVLFVFCNLIPAWHTDLWGHMNYGRWIVANKTVPTFEPTLPLAQGIPFVDLPWLSQVVGYLMYSKYGVPGIQFLNGLGIVIAAGLLTFAIFRRTGNLGASFLTLFAFYWVSYQQILVVRPQLGGLVCFALVFVMVTSARWRKWYTIAIPLVFAVWANVHGSFIVGLALLGAFTVGRACDVLLRTRNWKAIFAESGVRNLLFALELSAVAVLLNPYGITAYTEVLGFSGNTNLHSLIEWEPLTLRMKQGRAAFALALALVMAYRLSPRRATIRELLLLTGLTVGMLWYSRMIIWWAPVAAYYLGLHTAAAWRHWKKATPPVRTATGLRTIVALGILWIGFAYTQFGIQVIHGPVQDPALAEKQFRKTVSPMTPIDITDYLKRNPPTGLVFNPYEWGDYLQWAGPEGLQVFVNSHAHLIPEEVWKDYLMISNLGVGWANRLDRYGIQTLIVDKTSREDLARAMEEQTGWQKAFSDNRGVVFVRKPIGPVADKPESKESAEIEVKEPPVTESPVGEPAQ